MPEGPGFPHERGFAQGWARSLRLNANGIFTPRVGPRRQSGYRIRPPAPDGVTPMSRILLTTACLMALAACSGNGKSAGPGAPPADGALPATD